MGTDALWAGVAALGFAILFNVPVRTLPACFVNGTLGHALRTLLMHYGVGIEAATLAGSVLIGFLGVGCARLWNAPPRLYRTWSDHIHYRGLCFSHDVGSAATIRSYR